MQAVIPRLRESGAEVIGVDNFSRYGRLQRVRDYEFVEADLCHRARVDELMPGIDAVFQGAATIYGVGGFHRFPADILARDLALHQNLLWSALEAKVKKFVYISSSMVYERCQRTPSLESDVDDMATPRTDYGLSKLVGERLCRAFAQQYGMRYTIWRPFNIITPHERAEQDQGISHVFADFVRKIVVERQNPLPVLGDGQQIRCFTWIGDVADGIARHSLDPATDGEAFNLGNPVPITMCELAQRIHQTARELGLLPAGTPLSFQHLPVYDDDVRVRIPSVDKAAQRLGWRPLVSLEESLRRCVAGAAQLYAREAAADTDEASALHA